MSAALNEELDWEDITRSSMEHLEADLAKKKVKFDKCVRKRNNLVSKLSSVRLELEQQSGIIEMKKLKLTSKGKLIEAKELKIKKKIVKLEASVKERNKLSEVLEMEVKAAGENKKQALFIEKKLNKVEKKISKLKLIGGEETKLANKCKKLEVKLKMLESLPPPPAEVVNLTSASEKKISSLEATLTNMLMFLRECISLKESSLECPVCYTVTSPPINCCPMGHIICSSCLPRVSRKCPSCRTRYCQANVWKTK